MIHFSFFLSAVTQIASRVADNPAVALAGLLAGAQQEGFTRLVLLTGPELDCFAYRIAQLVGTRTIGNGRGLIPIFGQPSYAQQTLQDKCLIVILTMKGEARGQLSDPNALQGPGIPLIEIELESPSELAGESQNNLSSVAEQSKEVTEKRESLLAAAGVNEEGISLYVEREARRSMSTMNLTAALQTFLELRNADSYVAILPFFELAPKYADTMRELRDRMRFELGMPVQLTGGPRHLQALGWSYKQGPAHGIFIVITAEPDEDVAIPGAEYTFRDLQLALALAECEALEQAEKHSIRLHLSELSEKSLKQLADVVIQAVAQIRRVKQTKQD